MTQYPDWPEERRPDLLITMGLSNLSKPLHKALRGLKLPHWHISSETEIGHPFGTNLEHKCHYEIDFLAALDAILPQEYSFGTLWQTESQAAKALEGKRPHEYAQAQILLQSLSSNCVLHLGNSMPIRYASWFGKLNCEVRSNRGTSGIDGSLSTAIGAALAMPNKEHVLLLGDVSFIYDQHGLWANPQPKNLSIWVLNNGGGRIFEQIEGPGNWKALQERISSPHQLNLKALCDQYGVSYLRCSAAECIHLPAGQGLRVVEIPCHESSIS
jgi:2-succinyl-5-enolpyruvyl-6-hydroxy-3-cyclohexene-1-carboxylate synthase